VNVGDLVNFDPVDRVNDSMPASEIEKPTRAKGKGGFGATDSYKKRQLLTAASATQ